MTTEQAIPPAVVFSIDQLGAWEAEEGWRRLRNGRAYWSVRRRNTAYKGLSSGFETLQTKSKQQPRKFYTEAGARAKADELNASNAVVNGG